MPHSPLGGCDWYKMVRSSLESGNKVQVRSVGAVVVVMVVVVVVVVVIEAVGLPRGSHGFSKEGVRDFGREHQRTASDPPNDAHARQ